MAGRKRVASIGNVPRGLDKATTDFLTSLKEAVEVRLGRRTDKNEAAVTFNDLFESGLAFDRGRINPSTGLPDIGGGGGGGSGNEDPGRPPPKPANFFGVGVYGAIQLFWDRPGRRPDVVYTEIVRSDQPDRATASVIGGSGGTTYTDVLTADDELTYFYWCRHSNDRGLVGPWSDRVEVTKPESAGQIIEEITGRIDESVLAEKLNERIDLIDGPPSMEGSVEYYIQQEATARSEAISQEAATREDAINGVGQEIAGVRTTIEDVKTIQAGQGEDIASVQQTMGVQIERVDGIETQVGSYYIAKVQANGLVGGFGLYNDSETVDAAFDVDRFWVGRTNEDKRKPFIIENGNTYIDTAIIRDGSIESGMIGSLTSGKITLPDGTPVTTSAGLFRADSIDVDNIEIAFGQVSGDLRSTANDADGQPRWSFDRNGSFRLGQGTITDRVQIGGVNAQDLVNYANDAYDRTQEWVRPSTTLIDGNKIFAGDAYVDTLQLKGQAVTIPISLYQSEKPFPTDVEREWFTIASFSLDPEGAPVLFGMDAVFGRINLSGDMADWLVSEGNYFAPDPDVRYRVRYGNTVFREYQIMTPGNQTALVSLPPWSGTRDITLDFYVNVSSGGWSGGIVKYLSMYAAATKR